MPLRDHFRPPIWNHSSWEGFHGGWPMTIVQQLTGTLPADYTAEPRVHLGDYDEIDVCAFEQEDGRSNGVPVLGSDAEYGGLATATYAPPQPTLVLDADLDGQYQYEVPDGRLGDLGRPGGQLRGDLPSLADSARLKAPFRYRSYTTQRTRPASLPPGPIPSTTSSDPRGESSE